MTPAAGREISLDTEECPHCHATIVPTVFQDSDGVRSRTCPECGGALEELFESPWNRDEEQITLDIPTWVLVAVLGLIIVGIVVVLKVKW